MSVSICNDCTRRNCHKKPFATKREGRWACYKFLPIKGGWSMLELLVDSSPVELVTLCYRFGFEVKETKKGYILSGSKRMRKVRKHRRGKHKTHSRGRNKMQHVRSG
jgi:hypothetical protein